jgi:hypothetical protein
MTTNAPMLINQESVTHPNLSYPCQKMEMQTYSDFDSKGQRQTLTTRGLQHKWPTVVSKNYSLKDALIDFSLPFRDCVAINRSPLENHRTSG